MQRRIVVPIAAVAALVAAAAWSLWPDDGARYYTGFVEGEERVLRSEVAGRVDDVAFAEGDVVPANAVVALLDHRDISARITAKQRELDVLDAEIRAQDERIVLAERTWERDVNARRAEVKQAEALSTLAARTLEREQGLVDSGASTQQLLDDARARRDEAAGALDRARELLQRGRVQEHTVELERRQLDTLRQRRALVEAQLAELEVTRSKYEIRAPATETVVQTQFLWPGELAQPGIAVLSVLDPIDKYVRVYVPVSELAEVRVGRRVEIELDSEPGTRVPGEISFVADAASFTPEKIETRSDRVGQVYRVKVRILEDVPRFRPGTEGNVYLVDGNGDA